MDVRLPRALTVHGKKYAIRTDFRDVLKIVMAAGDPDLDDAEKVYVCLLILYRDFEDIPQSDYEEAYRAAIRFIDMEMDDDSHGKPLRIMDWDQDMNIAMPAINKVAGYEVRTARYVHWWTFLGYYMEITEGVFSTVLSIRLKKATHKKLEKWERDFLAKNKAICTLKEKLSEEEQAEKDRLNALLG